MSTVEIKYCDQCGQRLDGVLEGQCARCLLEAGLASQGENTISLPTSFRHHSTGALPSFARYRIVRALGGGGMGAVYEAEQDHPRRTVALKVIKPGMSSPAILRRFEQEAEALGRLQHPGIAQIYEAGTADSGAGPQPYFAMELIHGKSLRHHAEENNLSTRDRLQMIAKICDAVQHAHQRGLIHRDLKPSNILVDETGQPKVVDFGVARVTDRDTHATSQTDAGQLVGTLAYMSPEQVLAEPLELDTRSDVYALGVILYELLATKLPYTISNQLHQAIHTIREEEPARLSSVSGEYRGDIETIVAKALEKDKARRYSSAAELASDIRRYLADEPIIARPPSLGYQLGKFARRNKALMGGIVAVFLVLAGGIVVSLAEAARASRERDRATAAERTATESRDRAIESERVAQAERDRALKAESVAANDRDRALKAESVAANQRNRAVAAEIQARGDRDKAIAEQQRADNESATSKALNDFLGKDLLLLANPMTQNQTGRTNQQAAIINPNITIREALDRAAARVGNGRFDKQPLVEAAIRQTIGEIYQNMRLPAAATKQFEMVVELRTQALWKSHEQTLRAEMGLASSLVAENRYADARRVLEDVLKEDRLKPIPDLALMSVAESGIISTYLSNGRHADAIDFLRNNVIPYHQRVDGNEAIPTLASISRVVGVYAAWQPPRYQEAESFLKSILQEPTSRTRSPSNLSLTTTTLLGEIYNVQKRFKETVALVEPVFKQEWVDEVAKGGRPALDKRRYLPDMVGILATAYSQTGNSSRASALMKDEMRVMDVVLSAPEGVESVATPLNAMVMMLGNSVDTGRKDEAAELLPRVLEGYRQIAVQKDMPSLATRDLLFAIARLYASKDQPAPGLRLYHRVVDINRTALGDDDPEIIKILPNLSNLYINFDLLDDDYGEEDYRNAERSLKEAYDIQRRVLGPNDINSGRTLWALSELNWQRAKALKRLGKVDQTPPYLERAETLTREVVANLNVLPEDAVGATRKVVNQSRLAAIQGDMGQFEKVEEVVAQIQQAQRQTNGRVDGVWVQQAAIGWAQMKQGKYSQAEITLRPACNALALSQNGEALPHRYACESQLGAALLGQRKYAEAETLLLRGYEGQIRTRNQRQESFWRTFNRLTPEETAAWIVRSYDESGKPEEASKWRSKALLR